MDVLDVVTDGAPSAIHAHCTGILAGESNDELFNENTIFPITGDVTRLAQEFFSDRQHTNPLIRPSATSWP